jgi:dipeptidyl-peptidase-4
MVKRTRRPSVLIWLGLVPLATLWLAACRAPRTTPIAAPDAQPSGSHAPRIAESDGADLLRQYARTNRFRTGRPRAISFTGDGASMFFLRSPDGLGPQELCEYRVAEAQEGPCITAARLLDGAQETLTPAERARRERARETGSGITSYELSPDGRSLLVSLGGRLFIVNRADGGVRELVSAHGAAADARFSPDGTKVACVRGRELFVTDVATGREWQVTTGADSEDITNGLSEFVAQEEMGRFEGYWWSPDGARLAYQQTDTSGVGRVYIADAAYNDAAPATFRYPRAGTPNAVVRLGIIAVDGGETTWVDWDREKWEYLATVKWPRHGPLTVVLQNRAQTELSIGRVDPTTGELTEILRERDDTWINLDQSMPRWLPGGEEFLWISDREGDLQLELRAGDDGRLLRVLSPPRLTFHGFVGYDDVERVVYVHVSRDPLQRQLAAIRLDGGDDAFRFVTTRAGWHTATAAESGAAVHLMEESLIEPYHDVIHCRGAAAIDADLSRVRLPAETPSVELCEVGTERTIYAAIVRPRDFDPARKYPVIDFAYAGPGYQTVQARAALYYLNQWMADQGFIVVSIDGRGTPNRGRDWERAIKGDLMTRPLADHVAALPLLAEREPAMDLSRVGVFGWSYGGYFAAGAVARAPETYAAAVAGAPVTDWADYDTHYTERFLGTPDAESDAYTWSSVLAHVEDMNRPLLLIHGTADDNVHMIHSLKLADTLFRAGRGFEFLPLSGSTHMIVGEEGTVRLYERVMDFFERRLGEPKP